MRHPRFRSGTFFFLPSIMYICLARSTRKCKSMKIILKRALVDTTAPRYLERDETCIKGKNFESHSSSSKPGKRFFLIE